MPLGPRLQDDGGQRDGGAHVAQRAGAAAELAGPQLKSNLKSERACRMTADSAMAAPMSSSGLVPQPNSLAQSRLPEGLTNH